MEIAGRSFDTRVEASMVKALGSSPTEVPTLDHVRSLYVRAVVTACGGSKTKAAKILGVTRCSVWRWLGREAG